MIEIDLDALAESIADCNEQRPLIREFLESLNDIQLAAFHETLRDAHHEAAEACAEHHNRIVTVTLPAWAMLIIVAQGISLTVNELKSRIE
jgi:hypothetical protein